MNTQKKWVALLCLLSASGSAHALQSFAGKVRKIEATYMPTQMYFTLSEGNTACPAGKQLVWAGSAENNKAIYSTLLSALSTGKNIRFIMDDNDQSCVGRFLYIEEP